MRSRSASSTAGAGRLLDELLVAALDRAVALAEVDDVAVAVGEDLDLDVARVGQVALEVDASRSEKNFSPSRAAPSKASWSSSARQRDAEALAAAAARGLDRDRVADLLVDDLARASSTSSTGSVVPGTIGTPAACISSRARVLEPIASIALAGGPMKTIPASSQARAKAAFSARKP